MDLKQIFIIGSFIFTYIVFILVSKNIDSSGRRTTLWKIAQPLVLIMGLIHFVDIPFSNLVWLLFVGGSVGFVYPLIFAYYNREVNIDICLNRDFAMGYYITIVLLCLELLTKTAFGSYVASLITSLGIIIFTIPAIFQLLYAGFYNCFLDSAILQTLLYTHLPEVKDFFESLGLVKVFLLLAGYLAFAYSVFTVTSTTLPNVMLSSNSLIGVGALLLACLFLLFFRKGSFIQRCGLGKKVYALLDYQNQLAKLSEKNSIIENMEFTSKWVDNNLGTIIVVIGESANRKHMSAFTEYDRETTPWLSQMAEKEQFILFNNVYSSYVQTAQCLSMSLTNINQYNELKLTESVDIVSVANKCGFETYWFSNQGIAGVNNTPITIIANNCLKHRWILEDYHTVQYDEKLLQYLEQFDASKKNRIIFLHLKGSHMRFNCRYPQEFEKWTVKNEDYVGRDAYDNTILYTDEILRRIYEYGKEKLNMQAMLYFSDHSTDIGIKRRSYFGSFDAVRVPMFLYVSEKYEQAFSRLTKNMLANRNKYFTNDCIFDFMLGLLGISSNGKLEVKYDISCSSYNYEAKDLKTNLGKVSLAEDPDLKNN